jgi:hypothetical protein
MTLDNPAGSQRAVFSFFVPSVKPLQDKPERVSVALDGVRTGAPAVLAPGAQDVIVSIPASLEQRPHLRATLVMGTAWIPSKAGINGDQRELSVMLTRVGYI